jgi:Rab proteins geranylgeranyltransferase component A
MSTNDDAVDEPSKCEEGLLLEYDVILCGTGLVQSILASSLARAGKSILHVDARDFYGETDGVLTLPFIQSGHLWSKETVQEEIREMNSSIPLNVPSLTLHSTSQLDNVPVLVGTEVETPYGRGHVISLPSKESNKISILLDKWTSANGNSPHLHIGLPDTPMDDFLAYLVKQSIQPTILKRAQNILKSQSRSFAMDLSPNLIFASGVATHSFLTSGVAEYLEFKSVEGLLWFQDGQLSRVPCSKGDVFSSKLLKPMEKRRLMKFLQVVMDYGVNQQFTQMPSEEDESTSTVKEASVQSLNERTLNQGRSLSRPQNKAVSTTDLEDLMKEIENGNRTLQSYLENKHKLSHHLIDLVRYALALENNIELISLEEGMKNLCKHLQGLGKYGTTAFLTPLYGSGEFSQAFCRSAAVHGGTYLLRRQPRDILVGDDGNVSGIVLMDNDNNTLKTIKCKHVVTSRASLPVTSKQFILRRISIFLGRVVNDATEQRHVILIPPESKNVGNSNVIHGLALDWYSRIAAPETTVLHLSTTVSNLDDVSFLDRAAESMMPVGSTEIYHVTFSHVSPTSTFQTTLGLHICPASAQRLVADTAFGDAKVIFENVCQNVDFLALSKEMNTAVQERQMGHNDDDDERMLLESAVGMIESKDNIKNALDKDKVVS